MLKSGKCRQIIISKGVKLRQICWRLLAPFDIGANRMFHCRSPGSVSIYCSPYSISTALAMTYGGARGETAAQMAQTLHFNLPPDQLHPSFASLQADLNAAQEKDYVQLAVADSLWPQQEFAFLPDYLDLCRKYYDTSITPVDYKEHTEAARKTINILGRGQNQPKNYRVAETGNG